jgi:hypothetical protein
VDEQELYRTGQLELTSAPKKVTGKRWTMPAQKEPRKWIRGMKLSKGKWQPAWHVEPKISREEKTELLKLVGVPTAEPWRKEKTHR